MPRVLLNAIGYLAFAAGFAGLFLPLVPTVVFWIIAAACFLKTNPAMAARILNWPGVGPLVAAYLDHRVIGVPAKCIITAALAASFALSALLLPPGLLLRGLLLATLAGVAIFIWRHPSHPPAAA